jgi:hypothetical protein
LSQTQHNAEKLPNSIHRASTIYLTAEKKVMYELVVLFFFNFLSLLRLLSVPAMTSIQVFSGDAISCGVFVIPPRPAAQFNAFSCLSRRLEFVPPITYARLQKEIRYFVGKVFDSLGSEIL